MALSVDTPEASKAFKVKWNLPFTFVYDEDHSVLKEIGMHHPGGKMDGKDVARPGIFVIARDGRVSWFRAGSTVRERPDPEEVLAAVRKLQVPTN